MVLPHHSTMEDYYELLGVSNTATKKEIKRAYQRLALKCHPDKQCSINARESCEMFAKISEAWRILNNDCLREKYDAQNNEGRLAEHVPVNEVIQLSDMIFNEDETMYMKMCRCGGKYIIAKSDVNSGDDYYIYCDTCSLCVKLIICTQINSTNVI